MRVGAADSASAWLGLENRDLLGAGVGEDSHVTHIKRLSLFIKKKKVGMD